MQLLKKKKKERNWKIWGNCYKLFFTPELEIPHPASSFAWLHPLIWKQWLNAPPRGWWYLRDYFCLTHQEQLQAVNVHFCCVFPAVGDTLPNHLAASSDRSNSWRNQQPRQPEAIVSYRIFFCQITTACTKFIVIRFTYPWQNWTFFSLLTPAKTHLWSVPEHLLS